MGSRNIRNKKNANEEAVMNIETETLMRRRPARFSGRPVCTRCGNCLVAPKTAAFAGEGRIWHTWSCDECDYEFVTCVDLRA